ncbi:MAG: hypothetical protein E6Q88_13070 [Lysobacteraceae bacterium]|nr:MAG: hypothetical protein E6Q88_13070 [Xanthomonadaceae bacterium]
MQFTDEVNWGPADFAIFGLMLFGACGAYELAARMTGNRVYRAAVALALLTAFLLIWVTLAVGIIGDEGNPANLMFGGVLCIGIVSAFIARFRASGMALALLATALAQTLVAVIAFVAGWGNASALTVIFVVLWLASAWLFHRAARRAATA